MANDVRIGSCFATSQLVDGVLYEVLKVLNKTKVLLIFAKEISKIINDVFDTSFYI